jgi:predicted  nucleic acid-binding Zn-ribbon protein
MLILIAFIAGLGLVLASFYHTRIDPVAESLRNAVVNAKSDVEYFKLEAQRAKTELSDLRERIEKRIQRTADAAGKK